MRPSALALAALLPVLAACGGARPAPDGPADDRPVLTTPEAVLRMAERGEAERLAAALRAGADPDAFAPSQSELGDPLTPLMEAAKHDHADAVRVLLDAGADPNLADPDGDRALRWAADGNAARAARLLLDAGAEPGARNADGTSAAGWAAFVGATDALTVLLDAGVSPDEGDEPGSHLLPRALSYFGGRHGNAPVVDLLLQRGASPHTRDHRHYTPLHRAVDSSPGGLLTTALLVGAGASPGRTALGQTVLDLARERDSGRIVAYHEGDPATVATADLLVAVLRGDAAGVRAALAAGAVPTAGTRDDGFYPGTFGDDGTPLHLAASLDAPEPVLRALVEGGADPDAPNGKGYSPLYTAADHGHTAAARTLLALGASPDGADDRAFLGMTPIHVAAFGGHAEIVRMLLDAGAEPGYTTNAGMGYGYHALGFAVHHGHTEVVRMLLDAGMGVEHTGENPATPLDLAIERDWPETAALLRERGALTHADAMRARAQALAAEPDPWREAIVDGDPALIRAMLDLGDPPADALRRVIFSLDDDPEVVGLLVAAGADVDAAGYNGMTALHEAAANGKTELVEALLAAGADRALTDDEGKTALDWAREAGYPDAAALLTDG